MFQTESRSIFSGRWYFYQIRLLRYKISPYYLVEVELNQKINWIPFVLCLIRGQAEKDFKVEVATIGRVRHKNLVSLLGYCEGACRCAWCSFNPTTHFFSLSTVNWKQSCCWTGCLFMSIWRTAILISGCTMVTMKSVHSPGIWECIYFLEQPEGKFLPFCYPY